MWSEQGRKATLQRGRRDYGGHSAPPATNTAVKVKVVGSVVVIVAQASHQGVMDMAVDTDIGTAVRIVMTRVRSLTAMVRLAGVTSVLSLQAYCVKNDCFNRMPVAARLRGGPDDTLGGCYSFVGKKRFFSTNW